MNQFEQYKDRGLSGLSNLGNTCFLNSCMQVLSHTHELNILFDTKKFRDRVNDIPESLLLIEWNKLRQILWNENCIVSPGAFVYIVQKVAKFKGQDLFTGWSQNDMPEFLLFVIDCFHNSIKRSVQMTIRGKVHNSKDRLAKACYEMMKTMYKEEYSEFIGLFYGIHVSHLMSVCDDGEEEQNKNSSELLSFTPEPFSTLNLPIPPSIKRGQNISLLDCIELYTASERMEGDCGWYNEKTKERQDVDKRIVFWNLPQILIIVLKRFSVMGDKKTQQLIDFPLEQLDLSKYVYGYNKHSYVYNLYGICNHYGNVMGGHYTAFTKNANGKWHLYNDTTVVEVGDISKLVSPAAYCLFYRKCNPSELNKQ
jgi:ubiquitin carboxyl-terminal hydrolase 8